MVVQYSETLQEAIEKYAALARDHARAIGELCMSWAALDHSVDQLLEPLLNCDRAIVASVSSSVDRLEPRVDIAKRLIVHAEFGDPWQHWFFDIFARITDELGPLRNRYVHDRWRMRRGEMQRVVKRANVAKSQSREPKKLVFDSVHITPVAEVDRLRANIDTVTYAIEIASYDLEHWRKTGRLPRLRKLLIPASTLRTRMDRFPAMIVWNGEQLPPYEYVTDP